MIAIDTNVLVYYLDQNEAAKQAKAIALLHGLVAGNAQTVLLWQVLAELVRQLRAWQDSGTITRQSLLGYVAHFRNSFPLVMPTPDVLDIALDFAGRHSLSHWDSMILGACQAAGVTTLYTEDMGSPRAFNGIQLIDPFV